jgi:hypothetical protein
MIPTVRGRRFQGYRALHPPRRFSLLREDFQRSWQYRSPYWAACFLTEWCARVMRSRIEPMKKVARTLEKAWRADPELVHRQREHRAEVRLWVQANSR